MQRDQALSVLLRKLPGVREIDAEFADGASDTIRRAVSENATNLGFKTKDWE